uniref:carbohydrate porin n=1 Tax=Bradyrhizobium sp. (strain ORS 278) TaxID=114615 RepID=UPI000313427C|nr:carbohydrate porin [Bradyrhizobium sp. ORS 278]
MAGRISSAALALLITMTLSSETRADDRAAAGGQTEVQKQLADWGIQFNLTYIGETFANPVGGVRNGAIYTGRLDVGTTIDLEKLVGWSGATFHANAYQIHGDGLSRSYVGNLMLVSGVEALPASRLYEFWVEQALLGGKLLVRVGQQPSDVEFIDSKYDDLFANSALGWPGITGIILPSGGPSPPLAVPGIRLKAQFTDQLVGYLAVFDGDAAPPGPGDPQLKNPHGILFRVQDPPWVIGQLRYGFDLGSTALPGTIAAGAWYHFGSFDNQRFDSDGRALADPLSSGQPARMRRNQGVFAVFEQLLMRSPLDAAKGAGLFVRTSVSPSDRNLISFYLDGGIQFTGFSAARPDDKFGIAATYARISRDVRRYDQDLQLFTGIATPVRDFEAIFEASYSFQVTPNVAVQPIVEYVIHPGGGAVDPNDPTQTRRIRDAIVFGVRTTAAF